MLHNIVDGNDKEKTPVFYGLSYLHFRLAFILIFSLSAEAINC